MTFPTLINKQYAFFNVDFRFGDLKSIQNWIENRAARKAVIAIGEYTEADFEKIEKIKNWAGQFFLNKAKKVSVEIKNFIIENCHPIHYALSIQDYIFQLLEGFVNTYRVDFPGDKSFEEKWEIFKVAFAKLRYENDSPRNLINKTMSYLNYLSEEKQKLDQNDLSEISGVKIKNFILEILKDPDFLEFSVPQLSGLTQTKEFSEINISIEHLFVNSKNLQKRLSKDINWVTNYIEKKLKNDFEFCKENNFLNRCINKLLEINNKIKSTQEILNKTYYENIHKLINNKNKLKVELNKLYSFAKNIDECQLENQKLIKAREFSESVDMISFSAINSDFIQQLINLLKIAEKALEDNQDVKFNLKEALNSKGKNIQKVDVKKVNLEETFTLSLMLFPTYLNTQELMQIINFMITIKKCHIILNAYFIKPSLNYLTIENKLVAWAKRLKKNQISITNDFSLRKRGNVQQPSNEKEKRSSIPKKIKIENRREDQRSRATSRILEITTESKLDEKEKEPEPIIESTPAPYSKSEIEMLINQLEVLTEETTFLPKKAVLRDAQMYLKDLSTAEEQLKKDLHPNSKIFYLITSIQSSYFYLEQFLYNLRMTDELEKGVEITPATHNLKRSLNALGLKNQICCDVPHDLFLANYWTRSTFSQIRDRKLLQLPLPPTLKDIRSIYKNNYTVTKIMGLGKRIVDFSNQFTSLLSLKNRAVSRTNQSEKFRHDIQLKVKELQSIKMKCQNFLSFVNPEFRPKLKQAIYHLDLVEGILHEINQNEISSDLLSLLIRGLLFWENTVLEELMQVVYGHKTGVESNDHQLISLYHSTPWSKETSEEEEEFLTGEWQNIHNNSRYPFSYPHEKKNSLHGLILQSELLREHPELGLDNPFELNSSEQKTALNFLPVPKEGLHPKTIIQIMNVAHDKIINIINDRIVPEMEILHAE